MNVMFRHLYGGSLATIVFLCITSSVVHAVRRSIDDTETTPENREIFIEEAASYNSSRAENRAIVGGEQADAGEYPYFGK
jgi:hypothetical protein